MFQKGDEVFYLNSKNETYAGKVLETDTQVKISYNNSSGKIIEWVNQENLTPLRDTKCAHNEECGWCGDTGKCIYD